MSKALTDLLAKVELGQFVPRFSGPEHFVWPGMEDGNAMKRHHLRYAYHGSDSDAKALHLATMHERVVKKEVWSKRYGGTVELFLDLDRIGVGHSSEFASRAHLIAILKALIAKDQAND